MPTLNWMGREKATNAVKDVVMKILREDKSLGYKSHAEKKGEVAVATSAQFPHAALAERCKAPLNRLAARRETGSTIERE